MKRFLNKALITLALLLGVSATPALAQNFSSVAVLNGSCSAPSFTFFNDTDTGFFRASANTIGVCVGGVQVATINSNGVASTISTSVQIDQANGTVSATNATAYTGATSLQSLAGDLNVGAGTGTSTAGDSAYIAGAMGRVAFVGNMTDTENVVAGVIGKYDITGTNASTYAKAAVVGEVSGATVGQTSSSADGAFVAVIGGDEGPVRARAAYTADMNNSDGLSYFNYFADAQGPGTHSGYSALRYNDGFLRLGGVFRNAGADETVTAVCILAGTSAPTDGTSGTGAGNCGAGSVYFRQDGASSNIYTQRGTTASPTWVAAI